MWRHWHIDRRVFPSSIQPNGNAAVPAEKFAVCSAQSVQTQLCLSVLNIYQVSKGQDQGSDPSAQADVGGQCPDTSQHREETLPHLLGPSQGLWCCHTGKESTSASGSACMDSWRLGEDWERAGHSYTLTLLTCITLHPLEAPAAGSTTEQEQDELQASPQAAALFTPAVPQLRGHPFPGMDTGKGQLNLLPQCCQLQNVSSRAPKPDLFRIHKFL